MMEIDNWWEKARPTDKKCYVCGEKKKDVQTDVIYVGGDADWALTPIPWELCQNCKENGWVPTNAGMMLAYINAKLRKVKVSPDSYEPEEFLSLYGL